jgi:DNA-binding TFAR19-related protein (PDSD5 family)
VYMCKIKGGKYETAAFRQIRYTKRHTYTMRQAAAMLYHLFLQTEFFSGMLRRVALVRRDVSEELSASLIRVTRIGELGTTLAVTSNRRTLRRKTPFFIITAVKISKLT